MLTSFIIPFTRADTWIALGCLLFFANGIVLARTGRGLPYWAGWGLIAIDALQLAILRSFLPALRLIRAAFRTEFSTTRPKR